jgi:D-serine deaminase-like pyridoxal phosphate-dependent protein
MTSDASDNPNSMTPQPHPSDRARNPALASENWFAVADVDTVPSPALLVYRERVEENLRRMLAIAGNPLRLRPHIKTHKMREVIDLQLGLGIRKFKCATIAEAELAAIAGVPDLLLAYPPVGPAMVRFIELIQAFPDTRFSVIGDDAGALAELSRTLVSTRGALGRQAGPEAALEVLLDIDVGQHRTGVPAGPKAVELYRLLAALPGLRPGGLHAYDGQITDSDPATRAAACDAAYAPVSALRRELAAAGLPVPRLVAGGTPTFPRHAKRGDVECSPGTCVFWDAGYAHKIPDLGFLPAALVLARVVSKPGPNLLCLDLGHKAVAAEMPPPRVRFLNLEDAKAIVHSEEHLVVESAHAGAFAVGDCLYGIPWHICPTVALHAAAVIIEKGRTAGLWPVAARARRL